MVTTILRYKTPMLKVSPKKIMVLTRMIKGQPLDKIIGFLNYYQKRYSKDLQKSLLNMKSNVANVRSMDASNLHISKICIETSHKFYGIRYKAKGSSSKSTKYCCVLNIYLKQCLIPT